MLKSVWRPPMFLQVKIENHKLHYTISESKYSTATLSSETRYNIKHLSGNAYHVEMECKPTILSKINEDSEGNVFDLTCLKEVTGALNTIFIIIKPSTNVNFNEKLFEILECPECDVFMKPPIFLCSVGHSICGECKDRLKECPRCRNPMLTIRNYTLEEITGYIFYPCKYSSKGCDEVLYGTDLPRHETFCPYAKLESPSTSRRSLNIPPARAPTPPVDDVGEAQRRAKLQDFMNTAMFSKDRRSE